MGKSEGKMGENKVFFLTFPRNAFKFPYFPPERHIVWEKICILNILIIKIVKTRLGGNFSLLKIKI